MANSEWLYSRGDDDQQGPVSSKELNVLAESGELGPDDLIWKEGMDEWVPASRIKRLNFPAQQTETPPHPESKRLDVDSLQSTLCEAQKTVDEAAGVLWFLDLKFTRFVAPTLARLIWALALFQFVTTVVFAPILWLVDGDDYSLRMMFLSLILSTVMLLMFRIGLETFMVVFRMAEHLRQMNEKLTSN